MALQDAKAAKILVNDDVIIDVTYTTATEEAVFDGRTFLGADGRVVTGTLQVPLSYMANGGIAYIEKGCSTMHRNNLTNVIENNGTDFPRIAEDSLDKFDSFRYADFNRKPVQGEYFLVHTLDKDLHIVSFLGQVISLDDVDQTFEYAIVFMTNDAEAEALQVVYSDVDTSNATTSDSKRPGNNGIVNLGDKTASDLLESFLSSTELTFNARVFNRAPKEDEYFSFVAKTKDEQLLSIFAQITEVPSPDNTTYKYKILTLPNAQIGFAGAGEHAEIFNDYINNKAIGDCSHAEGKQTTASGSAAHAEGYYTTASGRFGSHAEGRNTVASGDYSHAEGEGSYSGIDYCINSLQYSPEEVQSLSSEDLQQIWTNCMKTFSWVKGEASHIEGRNNLVLGSYSHAEGEQNIVKGTCAHAEGCTNSASGTYSHTEGYGTIATSEAQHAQGKYNIEDTENTYVHIVGNGTDWTDENRSNAHTLDWKGNAWFAGDVYVDSTSGAKNKHADSKKLATEEIVQQKADAALADAKVYTDEVKAALIGTEELVGTYDTLKEIDAWIAQHGVKATELASALASETVAREAADENLSQQLTATKDLVATHTQLIGDLTSTTQNMDAAITGHTQSIGNLSQSVDGLGNILENNYYSKSEVDNLMSNTNVIPNAPIATFSSANELYNKCLNIFSEDGDIFNLGAWFLIENETGKYQLFVVAKGAGLLIEDYDYVPTSGDVMMGSIETNVLTTGTYSHFSNYGGGQFAMSWRFYCSGEYVSSEDVVTRDENGDILVPDFPTSGNAAIGWEYARTMMEEMSLQHRPAIIETTVDNNDKRDELLQSFIKNGYSGAELGEASYGEAILGPYGGDHVKITVTSTGLTHVYYYHYIKSKLKGDTKKWIEICQYYNDLSTKLSNISATNVAQSEWLHNLTGICATGIPNFATLISWVNYYATKSDSGVGGIEILPYDTNSSSKVDFILQESTSTPYYLRGPIRIIKNASGYIIMGDGCSSTGSLTLAGLHQRIYIKITDIKRWYNNSALQRQAIYRPMFNVK